ncbi:unnamed protein product, partial [marine sediment metagenome]
IRMDDTFEEVGFSYVDKQTGKKIFLETLENENYGYSSKKADEGDSQDVEIVGADIQKEKTDKEPEAKQIIIRDNQTGISYEKLFGARLAGSEKITLSDPYIRYPYQFKLLLEFCVMLSKIKNEEEEIDLHVITWNEEEFQKQSEENFHELSLTVEDIGINLSFEFKEGHDRNIISDNGWKIILGRGLDIFEKQEGRFNLGEIDQERRQCKACEVSFIRNA